MMNFTSNLHHPLIPGQQSFPVTSVCPPYDSILVLVFRFAVALDLLIFAVLLTFLIARTLAPILLVKSSEAVKGAPR